MQITLHKLTSKDFPNVRALWESAELHPVPSERSLAQFLESGCGMILRQNGRTVAVTLYAVCGPGRGYFEYFAVDSRVRKQGIGKRLYDACTADLFQRGVRHLVFLVDKGNETADAFWKRVGCTPIRGATPFYGKVKRPEVP